MKCSLLCISSLYVALFYLSKPIEVDSQIADSKLVRIGADFFTYHRDTLKWDDATNKCKGSGSGRLVNTADLEDLDVVDFIKAQWSSARSLQPTQWIWTNEKCGQIWCSQNVNWAPGYPRTPSNNKLIFDTQSGTYRNIGDGHTFIVTQFACMHTESNFIRANGVVNTTNGLCYRSHCVCHFGTACSGRTCTGTVLGNCCLVASSCTTPQPPATTTTTPLHVVTSVSTRAPATAATTTPLAVTSTSSRAPVATNTPRVNPPICASNPCQNGGTCITNANGNGVACNCTAAFQGMFCQTPAEAAESPEVSNSVA